MQRPFGSGDGMTASASEGSAASSRSNWLVLHQPVITLAEWRTRQFKQRLITRSKPAASMP